MGQNNVSTHLSCCLLSTYSI